MRRKKLILISIGFAVILVTLWLAFHHPNNLKWMQKASGVHLPRGIKDVSIYDNGEMFITAHVLLPSGAINDFANTFGCAPVSNAQSGLLGLEQLDPRFRKIPPDADLVAFDGRSKQHTWIFVLDKRSGHLWFTVHYPDMAGNPP